MRSLNCSFFLFFAIFWKELIIVITSNKLLDIKELDSKVNEQEYLNEDIKKNFDSKLFENNLDNKQQLETEKTNILKENDLNMDDIKEKPDFKFSDPLPTLRAEDLALYENASDKLILSVAIPIMNPREQFDTIRRISRSHYKGLPKSHREERTNINWCKIILSKNSEMMFKIDKMYKLIQLDLIGILGGIGRGGSVSSQGISGTRAGIGWTQQNICEGLFLLETYKGIGDCEKIFLDLLARYHGQWGLFFKMFRQKFRKICRAIGYSEGLWDVSNDRAYSSHTVLKSSKRSVNIKLSTEGRKYVNYLRNRSGICSLLTIQQRKKAKILKHAVESISQIKHISIKMSLLDYCDIILGKQTIEECVDGLIVFFKLKSESYFNSSQRYRSIEPLLSNACREVFFRNKIR